MFSGNFEHPISQGSVVTDLRRSGNFCDGHLQYFFRYLALKEF